MSEGIVLHAALDKISTVKDGGWRVSFDVSESETQGILQLAQLRETLLTLVIVQTKEEQPVRGALADDMIPIPTIEMAEVLNDES